MRTRYNEGMMNSDPEGGPAMINFTDNGYIVLDVEAVPMVPFDAYDVATYAHFYDVPVTAVHMLAGENLLLTLDLADYRPGERERCDCGSIYC